MKLLYLDFCTWEYDIIVNDILNDCKIDVEIYKINEFNSLLNRSELINNNILVINIKFNINEIINVVEYIKPVVIFYLSDESGCNSNITILEKHTKLLFIQYNHFYPFNLKNNYQLPLAYATNFLDKKNSLTINQKKISERNINCSFIGQLKSDRLHMSNVFKQNMENTNIIFVDNSWDINNLVFTPHKCFEIYNDSIFVISGRGNCSLDCFRIYEAIVAGAIPVVVGPITEIQKTFYYNNDMPPFIHDETWEQVVIKCNNLLNNNDELQKKQDELLLWWKNKISFYNNLIKNTIQE